MLMKNENSNKEMVAMYHSYVYRLLIINAPSCFFLKKLAFLKDKREEQSLERNGFDQIYPWYLINKLKQR